MVVILTPIVLMVVGIPGYIYSIYYIYIDIYTYLDPPFGCQISAPKRSVFGGFFWGLKFQTRLEDSGI